MGTPHGIPDAAELGAHCSDVGVDMKIARHLETRSRKTLLSDEDREWAEDIGRKVFPNAKIVRACGMGDGEIRLEVLGDDGWHQRRVVV